MEKKCLETVLYVFWVFNAISNFSVFIKLYSFSVPFWIPLLFNG